MKAFNRKFGAEFWSSLPSYPGVYRVFNLAGELIYVGKAKNLRRRLAQYRNAKRRKIHRKMKLIVAQADRISFEVCQSDAEALKLELKLIQDLKPKLNISQAFSFLYPFIGVKMMGKELRVIVTSCPQAFSEHSFHGCYRSHKLTRASFQSLRNIFYHFGMLKKIKHAPNLYSREFLLIGANEKWKPLLENFLSGRNKELLTEAFTELLEKSGAHQRKSLIQSDFEQLMEFWKVECLKLRDLYKKSGTFAYPISQIDRDRLSLELRLRSSEWPEVP